jgi:hypothetical protein
MQPINGAVNTEKASNICSQNDEVACGWNGPMLLPGIRPVRFGR